MRERIARLNPATTSPLVRRAGISVHYRTGIDLFRRDTLIPPPWLHHVGAGDYAATGDEFVRHLEDLAALTPSAHVLDLGSGTGRMARALTTYLTDGAYDGLDVVADSVAWCRKAYAPRFPNFRFHHADVFNRAYNPDGRHAAGTYRFPFDGDSFDVGLLASVFTHMLPADCEHYLAEIARVLKPGGRCLVTYFVLNPGSELLIDEHASDFEFATDLGECRVDDPAVAEHAVAYPEERIRLTHDVARLPIIEPIRWGTWCGRPDGLSYQDIVIAEKPARRP